MRIARFVTFLLVLAMGGCGGGGGGGASPVPPPKLSVSLSTSAPEIKTTEGQGASFTFIAKVANAPTGATPQVSVDESVFSAKSEIDSSVAGQYTVTLHTRADLSSSLAAGQVSFRLCEDAACNKPYAGSQQSLAYSVNFRLRDWATAQRNASHTGYAPIVLDPSKFKQLWSWWLPAAGALNAPVTGEGKVFVSSDNYYGDNGLYAFDESSGKMLWSIVSGNLELDPPAYANGFIFVHARELKDSLWSYSLWMVKASTGALVRRLPMNIGDTVLAPTPEGDTVFTNGAGWGGGVSAFGIADGALRWQVSEDYRYFTSPAATEQNVFYYSGSALTVYKRSGDRLITIRDAAGAITANSSDYQAVPMIGSSDNVIALSGTQFSGHAGSSPAGGTSRPIVNLVWSGANPGTAWLSEGRYLTQPALANGVVYAGTGAIYAVSGYTARFDAIDEITGKVLWSWTAPGGDTSFYRNVVVAKNLLFVSTDKNVYALDLKTHQPVWQAPYPGSLALFGEGMLAITTGGDLSDGRVTVIQLH